MARWRWFQRQHGQDVDPIGPATIYGGHRGGYAAGAAPVDQQGRTTPVWNAPTVVDGARLLTYGQQRCYRTLRRSR